MTRSRTTVVALLFAASLAAAAQQSPEVATANPGRPTVSTPATLTPPGYLQFETGYLFAAESPGLSTQSSLNEVAKFSVSQWLQLLASDNPSAHSRAGNSYSDGSGGVSLGAQAVAYQGRGVRPTVALSYFREVYGGNTPDLDIGSAKNSALLLLSADVKGFHYDTNFIFNEVIGSNAVAASVGRAQFGQTLSVSHSLRGKWGLSGELWRFTQPFLRGNAIGNLWAVNYNLKSNLVLDAGFNRGLTRTSTQWEVVTGFTYLLPHRLRFH